MQKLDLTGQTFGRLTVISPAQNKGKKTAWLCLCSCGNEKIIRTSALTRGLTKSCGCINHDNLLNRNIKHNLSHFRIYRIWECIKTRCINQNTNYYKHYGKRGIKLCDAWLNFENFKNWAFSNGYSEGLTIDRIDVNGNYEPSNLFPYLLVRKPHLRHSFPPPFVAIALRLGLAIRPDSS